MGSNHNCYTFQKMEFKNGFLDASVDATYIITMEGGPRYQECIEKLKEYQPTKRVYILLNKGFKKCKKELPKQSSMYDIIDANLQIFKHALRHNYETILILEDDFIFHKDILDTSVNKNVNRFLNNYKQTSFIYTLGCLPVYVTPYTFNTFMVLWGHGMHAVVYSKQFRNHILEYTKSNQLNDWDMDISKICLKEMNKFMYRYPLCYQTIPNTENKQSWGMSRPAEYVLDTYIKATHFDTKPEPGTTILYILANLLFIITILICALITYTIYTGTVYKKLSLFFRKVRALNK